MNHIAGQSSGPNNHVAHARLGQALSQIGDNAAAVSSIRRAIECDPKRAAYHFALGVVLFNVGNRDVAFEAFRRAKECDPNLKLPSLHIGNAKSIKMTPVYKTDTVEIDFL